MPSSVCLAGAAPLGLGCVTFGREIDRGAAFALMDHAVARGVLRFDTAAAYGGGASETIVGEWLAAQGASHRVAIGTKLLPPYTPDAIMAGAEASLRRLGVACVDTLYLHRWDATAESEGALRALDRLVREGRVRALGASNFSAPQLASGLERQHALGLVRYGALQNVQNYAVCGIDSALRRLCAAEGVEIVTYSPLGAGFLTGKHRGGAVPGSRFAMIPGHQDIYFNDDARRRFARLEAVAAGAGMTPIQLALAWALRQPQVTAVLVGGRTPAHLDQALAAHALDVSAALRELDTE